MQTTVDPELKNTLTPYGIEDAAGCFNCGNCTAICELSSGHTPFPRKLIRYLQLGLKERILKSPEPWLCYYCADCSDTCPRQTNPGEVMMGLRRYQIANLEPTGLGQLFYRKNVFAALITIVLAAVLTGLLLTEKAVRMGQDTAITRWLFGLVDYHFIEYIGMAVFVIVLASLIGGLKNIVTNFSEKVARVDPEASDTGKNDKRSFNAYRKAGIRVLEEIFLLKRYRTCANTEDRPLILQTWFIHGAIMWGFFGLAAATVMDIPWLGLKDPNVDTWLPSRILGILSGLFLMYGTTVAFIQRIRKSENQARFSRFTDWMFLAFLWALGATGFWLTASIYFSQAHLFHQIVLVIHTVLAMELLLLFAFSKFAHVVYRPIALFYYFLNNDTNTAEGE